MIDPTVFSSSVASTFHIGRSVYKEHDVVFSPVGGYHGGRPLKMAKTTNVNDARM